MASRVLRGGRLCLVAGSSTVSVIGAPTGFLTVPGRRSIRVMARLIRMDNTGHTTLAEWNTADPASVESAVAALRTELDKGYYAVVNHGEGRAEQVTALPMDADLVILRR